MTPPSTRARGDIRVEERTETTSLRGTESTRTTGVRLVAGRALVAARRARRSATVAGTWLGSTVTPVGWFVAAAAIVGLWLGLSLNWSEMFVVGIASVLLIGIAALFLIGGKSYDLTISLDSDRVVAGNAAGAHVSIANSHTGVVLPARIEVPVGAGLVEFAVPTLVRGANHRKRIDLPAMRRGVVDVGPVRAIRGDPIGLMRRTIDYTRVQRLWVHPQTVTLPNISVGSIRDLDGIPSTTIVSSDVSFHAIREYQPGDAQRNVHWKSTAKTGKLMVRQYEESRRSSQAIVLSLADNDYATPEEFELAVSAAASLGLQGIRFGRDTTVSVSTLIPEFQVNPPRKLRTLPTTSRVALLDAASGVVPSPRAANLVQTSELTGLFVERMSVAFLISGTGTTLNELQSAALRLPFGVRTVVVLSNPLAPPRMNRIGALEIFGIAVIEDLAQLARRRAL